MAKVVSCDRCGRLEPEACGYDVMLTPQYTTSFTDDKAITGDLCRKCAADFKAFMRNEDVSRQYRTEKED
jgi:hypothetical protein